MIVLGIETSCDDTAAAVVEGRRIRSNTRACQDDLHAAYGGIVPELAARRHLETIAPVVERAMREADVAFEDLDAIAVTRGPGLIGSLLVGIAMARGLGIRTGLPVYGVHHLEGHVLSPITETEVALPVLSLLVSGGHTALYLVEDVGRYRELAATRDDSAGEAFDKAAKMLGLGYPGGRVIDELAQQGDPTAIRMPRARVRDDPMALSFSGLKTALWEFLHGQGECVRIEDVCASFQEAIVDVLIDRVIAAIDRTGVTRVTIGGGVAANSRLRARMQAELDARGAELAVAPLSLCADNAAMIAATAIMRRERGLAPEPLTAAARLPLGRAG